MLLWSWDWAWVEASWTSITEPVAPPSIGNLWSYSLTSLHPQTVPRHLPLSNQLQRQQRWTTMSNVIMRNNSSSNLDSLGQPPIGDIPPVLSSLKLKSELASGLLDSVIILYLMGGNNYQDNEDHAKECQIKRPRKWWLGNINLASSEA